MRIACVGGGVIGLMTALELVRRGCKVEVFERGEMGKEASWAGAGILPPANLSRARTPLDQLRGVSHDAYPILADELRATVGVDIGLRYTGGLELPESPAALADLVAAIPAWEVEAIAHRRLGSGDLRRLEPELAPAPRDAFFFPGMRQTRNPWLMRGLTSACQAAGVTLRPGTAVARIDAASATLTLADGVCLGFDRLAITAGAWTRALLQTTGVDVPIYPLQGQIVALRAPGVVHHIVLAGKRYLVPRDDGIVLIGSTEEDVGFAKQVTATAGMELRGFAAALFPRLANAPCVAHWAGLRPGCRLSSPIIGPLPDAPRCWLAAGHFRQGVQLAPASARFLADGVLGLPSFAPADAFALDADRSRHVTPFHS